MAKTTNIIFDESTATPLRDLAASLGFYIKRGPGTGEIGNIKAMLERMGQVYEESPEIVQALLQILVRWHEKDAKGARPWVDLVCQHAWLGNAEVVPGVCPVCGDDAGEICTVYDMRRVRGGSIQPYTGKTAWDRMANQDLSRAAQEQVLEEQ